MFNSPISNMQLVRRDPPVVPELKADMTDPSAVDTGHHPLFTEGDVTLASKDGFLFRVHSHTLRTTSGFFRSMFSLPQDVSEPALFSKTGTLYLEEDKDTLDGLLRMMCGLELPTLHTPEQLDALLEAIEKYDTPGPLSIVRLLVIAPTLEIHPLRLYGIARRFGWDAEAKHASSQSLVNNLFDPTLRFYLQRLSTESLLKLLDLHRTRREGLRQRLNDHPFVNGAAAHCINCNTVIDYHTWRELKYKMVFEIDLRPLGDTVVDVGLLEWPEAQACWSARCPKVDCGRSLYDKNETLRVIRDCIDKLPKTI